MWMWFSSFLLKALVRRVKRRIPMRIDWNDPLLYDLTINTGKIDREDAVDLLASFLAE